MQLTVILHASLLAASVSAYTEVTQWTGNNCGRGDGHRTSYTYIDGYNTYINADRNARSIYFEVYDARPRTFFCSDYNGGGYRRHEAEEGYCFVWYNEQASSIANRPEDDDNGRSRMRRGDQMVAGELVQIDSMIKGFGGGNGTNLVALT